MKTRHHRFRRGIAGALCLAAGVSAAQIQVQPTATRQTLHGFGGALVYNSLLSRGSYAQSLYDTLFTGLGIDILRVGNWHQDTTVDLGQWTHRWTRQVIDDSIVVAEGKKRLPGLKLLMSSWTPPAWLKSGYSTAGNFSGLDWISSDATFRAKNGALGGGTLRKVNGQWLVELVALTPVVPMPSDGK